MSPQTRKLPEPLPKETWNGQPVQSKPFTKESASKLEFHMSEVEKLAKSDFFKIAAGEQIEVYFDMENEDTGVKTKTIKGDEVTHMNFVLWNVRDQCEQEWFPSNTWASKAMQSMKDFNTNNLIIRRKGSGMQDTSYDFLPVGLKTAG